jgi:low temperature requirement protein LtrA
MNERHKNLSWWGPPKKFDERKNERKISWLELFYDLVYVAAIAQVTHHLSNHLSWHELLFSFLLFSLIFLSWINGSQYYDLHGSDSIRTRLLTFWQMLGVAAVAITIPDAYEGHHQNFAIAFAIIELLITYLWWSVGIYDRSHRVFNIYYTVNYLIAFALLITSVFFTNGTAMILWVIVLVLNLTPGLIGARTVVTVLKQRGQVFSASATLVERFGLFTIIVLAESILGTVNGIAEVKDKAPSAWIAFILGILISFLLWSIYFDMTSEQETKKGYSYLQWFLILHFPLLMALSVIGACFKILLTGILVGVSNEVRWMFCIAIATILFVVVAITKIMEEDDESRSYIRPVSRLMVVISICILLIPLFSYYIGTNGFLSVIAILLFIPVFIGVRSWVLYRFFDKR